MSEESIVETEGITVTKSFDAEGFPVPAVTFQVESDRSDPVGLRITDEIPEDFGIEQIGFHPDYGSEHWTATGEGIVRFERTVNPGEAFTTVYGIRMAEDEEPTPFLETPSVDVDPEAIEEADIGEVVPKETSEVVRELAGGERDSVPGLEEEEAEPEEPAVADEPESAEAEASGTSDTLSTGTDDAEILGESETGIEEEPADAEEVSQDDDEEVERDVEATTTEDEEILTAEPGFQDTDDVEAEPDTAVESDVDNEEAVEEPPAAAETPPTAESETTFMSESSEAPSIAATLAAEIRDGNVAEDDLETIKAAVLEATPSDHVRVEHLQSRVSDLEAYSDALEEFIDEKGTGQQVLAELDDEVEALRDELGEFENRLESGAEVRESLSERVDTLETGIEELDNLTDRIDRLRGDLEALDERVDDAESLRFEFDSLEEDLESLRADITEIEEWRDQLQNVFK